MAKGGGGEGALGNREKPLLEYIERRQATILEWVALQAVFDVCAKETGFERGEVVQEAVAPDSRVMAAEDHTKRDFGSGKGAATIVI